MGIKLRFSTRDERILKKQINKRNIMTRVLMDETFKFNRVLSKLYKYCNIFKRIFYDVNYNNKI